jgi:hypothetical protein
MDRQAVLSQPLRDDFRYALGVAVIAEPNHEVISIASQASTVSKTGVNRRFKTRQ